MYKENKETMNLSCIFEICMSDTLPCKPPTFVSGEYLKFNI